MHARCTGRSFNQNARPPEGQASQMARNDSLRKPQSPPPRSPAKPKKPRFRWLKRLFAWGVTLTLLFAIVAGVSVFVAAQSLPSYDKLKSSQNGQMIVVRARDGSELVSLGPSYGKWMPYSEIPTVMKDAIL